MKSISVIGPLFLLGTVFNLHAFQPETKTFEISGPVIEGGFGTKTGGLGILAEYQFRISNRKIVLSPYLGLGTKSIINDNSFMMPIGVDFQYGNLHRLIIGTGYSWLGTSYSDRDTVEVKGFEIHIGYKAVFRNGFTWEISGGLGNIYHFREISFNGQFRPAFSLIFGYKFHPFFNAKK